MMTEINCFAALIIEHAYDIVMLLLVCFQTLIGYLSLRPRKARVLRFPRLRLV
jgi:hypothetical protein